MPTPQTPLHKGHITKPTPQTPLHKGHFTKPTPQRPLHKGYFTKHTPQTPLHKAHSTKATSQRPLHKAHSTNTTSQRPVHVGHSTNATSQGPLHKVHSTNATSQRPVHEGHSTNATSQRPLHKAHSTNATSQRSVYKAHSTNATSQRQVHSAHSTNATSQRHVLEQYCQDDVTVLRQACRLFRREFLEIGNIEVFLEALTIASACNKVLRKKILKPETIGLIPPGGYSANRRYSKKVLWLLHTERMDGCHIRHARNGREFRPPELPHYSVDGYCAETRTIYKFLGCYYHGCKCQPFRDVKTLARGETLAERYEQTLARSEQLKSAGYTVKVVGMRIRRCRRSTYTSHSQTRAVQHP